MDSAALTFKKLPVTGMLKRTLYEVFIGKKPIGFVWSYEGFCYRGTQGWNSGIRIRDYHPIEWACSISTNEYTDRPQKHHQNRRLAAEGLLRMVREAATAP